jgi:hypothetical protein
MARLCRRVEKVVTFVQLTRIRLHALVMFSTLVLARVGHMPDNLAGWTDLVDLSQPTMPIGQE